MFIFHFVLADCNETDRENFKCELDLLLSLKHHDNVVKLLGHCKSKDLQLFLYVNNSSFGFPFHSSVIQKYLPLLYDRLVVSFLIFKSLSSDSIYIILLRF